MQASPKRLGALEQQASALHPTPADRRHDPGIGSLTYDPLGRLRSYTTGGATTQFLYDGDRLVAEYNASNGALLRRYAHGPGVDEPLIWYEGASVAAGQHWLIADRQGSIVATTNASGAATNYAYGPYGEPHDWDGPNGEMLSCFRYTGQIALPELQLYHYKARVYDPGIGRFLQTDPVGYEDDLNLYQYVANDPLNRSDPTGMEGFCGGTCYPEDLRELATPNAQRAIAVGVVGVVTVATVAGVIVTSEAAGGVVASSLLRAGAPPAAATMLGEGTAGAVAASELQTITDVASGEGFSPGRTAAAGGMGFFGGSLTGAIPSQAGNAVRAGMGAPVGALSAAVVGGGDTSGTDLVLGAASGAGGVYSNSVSTTFDLVTGASGGAQQQQPSTSGCQGGVGNVPCR